MHVVVDGRRERRKTGRTDNASLDTGPQSNQPAGDASGIRAVLPVGRASTLEADRVKSYVFQ